MDPQIQDVQPSKRINEPNSEHDMTETEIDVEKCTKDDGQEAETVYCSISTLLVTVCGCLQRNQFVICLFLAIVLAKAYPPVGASYVQADITATWIAVMIIFLISGIGLKVEELSKAFQQIYFNSFVQIFNFGIVSAIVFGVSRFLGSIGAISSALADGMLICSCLPVSPCVCYWCVSNASLLSDSISISYHDTDGNQCGDRPDSGLRGRRSCCCVQHRMWQSHWDFPKSSPDPNVLGNIGKCFY